MPETVTPATRQTRFRTSRFPGFYGGTTDPATGNLVAQQPRANPNAAAVNDELPARPSSGLAGADAEPAPLPESKPSPGLGVQAVGAGLPFAGSTIGTGAGEFLAANPGASLGEAVGAGVGKLGAQVADLAGSFGLGSGAGEAAAAAGAQAAGSPVVGTAITDVGRLGTQGSLGVVSGGEAGAAGAAATPGLGAAPAAGASAAPAGAGGEAAGAAASKLPSAGGAIGAGLGTFAAGLIMGQNPGKAALSGAASGIGFYIGTAVGGPVGGFIGSVIGSIFGGRVICTELMNKGLMERDLWAADMEHARTHMNSAVIRGYHCWGIPVVRLMRRDDWLGRLANGIACPLSTWRAEEIGFVMHRRRGPNWKGRLVRLIGEPLCWVIGQFVGEQDISTLQQEAV